ncbi:MAG: transposase [Actinomycetota bacterium]|nr:transposase [Actinomycetota bacterium]
MLVTTCRDAAAARRFIARALRDGQSPAEVTTDRAPVYPRIVEDLEPSPRHVSEQYANVIEADQRRLKARLRPTRGLKRVASARTTATGHAFVQNLRRRHYAITVDLPPHDRLCVAFDELALNL